MFLQCLFYKGVPLETYGEHLRRPNYKQQTGGTVRYIAKVNFNNFNERESVTRFRLFFHQTVSSGPS